MKTTIIPQGGGPDRRSPVLIRRGTGIGYSVYHMHRRTDLYGDDAAEFRPERWEENDLASTIGWGFMPFHGGPRICLGSESRSPPPSRCFSALTFHFSRGFCADGSLLCTHPHHSDLSKFETAT